MNPKNLNTLKIKKPKNLYSQLKISILTIFKVISKMTKPFKTTSKLKKILKLPSKEQALGNMTTASLYITYICTHTKNTLYKNLLTKKEKND